MPNKKSDSALGTNEALYQQDPVKADSHEWWESVPAVPLLWPRRGGRDPAHSPTHHPAAFFDLLVSSADMPDSPCSIRFRVLRHNVASYKMYY